MRVVFVSDNFGISWILMWFYLIKHGILGIWLSNIVNIYGIYNWNIMGIYDAEK